MRSKALVRFLNRVARFDDDIELIDVFVRAIAAGDLTSHVSSRLFDHIEPSTHPRLAKARATDHNRGLVVGHLRKTVYSSYIKDLYEDFTEYLNELVVSAFRKGLDPVQLRGEYKVLVAADELLGCEDWDAALQVIADSVGHRLDAMGNHKKLDFLDKRLGLTIDSALVDAAMPFIDLRHLLVHMDGKADEGFCSRCEGLGARPGESVRLTEQTTRNARAAITALVEHIDARAVDVGILQDEDQQ
jgi:hypothetical protein